jgi:hypothetical protein
LLWMRLEQQNWILMKTPMPSVVALFSQGRRGGAAPKLLVILLRGPQQ